MSIERGYGTVWVPSCAITTPRPNPANRLLLLPRLVSLSPISLSLCPQTAGEPSILSTLSIPLSIPALYPSPHVLIANLPADPQTGLSQLRHASTLGNGPLVLQVLPSHVPGRDPSFSSPYPNNSHIRLPSTSANGTRVPSIQDSETFYLLHPLAHKSPFGVSPSQTDIPPAPIPTAFSARLPSSTAIAPRLSERTRIHGSRPTPNPRHSSVTHYIEPITSACAPDTRLPYFQTPLPNVIEA
ncbi:hypothetical protein NMY22_g9797 [Coprinellus aureogranulatus]|nr:hypothetical protein NMY22_g9797 [Coprinellus aureogranulatus]